MSVRVGNWAVGRWSRFVGCYAIMSESQQYVVHCPLKLARICAICMVQDASLVVVDCEKCFVVADYYWETFPDTSKFSDSHQ